MNFRRHFCVLAAVAAIASLTATSPGQAETRVVKIAKQFGISYLPLTIMEQKKLLEAEGKKQGLDLSTEWMQTSPDFARDPIGTFFDPAKVLEAFKAGADFDTLHKSMRGGGYLPASEKMPDIGLPAP